MTTLTKRVFILVLSLFSFSLLAQTKPNTLHDSELIAVSKKAAKELNKYQETFADYNFEMNELVNKMETALVVSAENNCLITPELREEFNESYLEILNRRDKDLELYELLNINIIDKITESFNEIKDYKKTSISFASSNLSQARSDAAYELTKLYYRGTDVIYLNGDIRHTWHSKKTRLNRECSDEIIESLR